MKNVSNIKAALQTSTETSVTHVNRGEKIFQLIRHLGFVHHLVF